MLLTLRENQMGGKGDILSPKWFSNKGKEYLEMHIIPPHKKHGK